MFFCLYTIFCLCMHGCIVWVWVHCACLYRTRAGHNARFTHHITHTHTPPTPTTTHPPQTPPGSGIYNTTWLLPLPGHWETHPASAGGTVPNPGSYQHVYTGRNYTRMSRRVRVSVGGVFVGVFVGVLVVFVDDVCGSCFKGCFVGFVHVHAYHKTPMSTCTPLTYIFPPHTSFQPPHPPHTHIITTDHCLPEPAVSHWVHGSQCDVWSRSHPCRGVGVFLVCFFYCVCC